MMLVPIESLPVAYLALAAAVVLATREWQSRSRRQAMNLALHELRRPLQQMLLVAGLDPVPAEHDRSPVSAVLDPDPFPAAGGLMVRQAIDALGELSRELNGGSPTPPTRERLDLQRLIESCARRWRSRASLADASISVRWQGPPAEVIGDPGVLSQAFDNLVVNAIEHGGRRIEISAEPCAGSVDVEVIDSGSESQSRDRDGSPAHIIERLCGRQRHGHGLAVVERAVRQHGGRFDLKLSPQGSTADVHLPIAGRLDRAA